MANKRFNDASRKRLNLELRKEVTFMMEQALDYAHVACPPEHYKQLRSKILRAGNNCMRNVGYKLNHYYVSFTQLTEEIIEFR